MAETSPDSADPPPTDPPPDSPVGDDSTAAAVAPAGPQADQTTTPTSETVTTQPSDGHRSTTGQALARQADPALIGARPLTLAGASGLQGRRNVIPLSSECVGSMNARVEGLALPVVDIDQNPATFTFEAVGLELGTRQISFDCGNEIVANIDLFVYRQNGAERGGANSIALISAVALAAMIALFALPTSLNAPIAINRVDGPPNWPPPTPR